MKKITPLKAIKNKCMDCMCYQINEMKACPCINCPLWLFRLGKNPYSESSRKNHLLKAKNYEGKHYMTSIELLKDIRKKKMKQ